MPKRFSWPDHPPMEEGVVTKPGWHMGADRGDPHDQQEKQYSGLPEERDGQQDSELDENRDPLSQEDRVKPHGIHLQGD